jgi:hypothetical protein
MALHLTELSRVLRQGAEGLFLFCRKLVKPFMIFPLSDEEDIELLVPPENTNVTQN